jgi:hypothetical protein
MVEINEGFDSPPEGVAVQGVDSNISDLPSRSGGLKVVRGATLSYHDLQYTVEIPGKCCRKAEKQILFGVR